MVLLWNSMNIGKGMGFLGHILCDDNTQLCAPPTFKVHGKENVDIEKEQTT